MLCSSKLDITFPGQNKLNHQDLNLSCIKNQMKKHAERQHPGEVGKSVSEIDKRFFGWFCSFAIFLPAMECVAGRS